MKILNSVPNRITTLRLVLIPVLWIFAIRRNQELLGLGVFIELVTDIVDGWIARKLNQVTEFGSKYDSWVDALLVVSTIYWLLTFIPEIVELHLLYFLTVIILNFIAVLIGITKFRRFANLHLYSSKFAALFTSLFFVHALIRGQYSPEFFYFAFGVHMLSSVEMILIQLFNEEIDEHQGSLLARNPESQNKSPT
ncbi:MAG: CDP-alcohol phosphatidyltransferase family protein [Candidatus Kariarchaeaceae archaeon]|jgi:CDP-diacylglycerol--glycerol-3-phosphate 3-phosphatidyltransferase